MRIATFTNTYLPHVGGVANSTSTLVHGLRDAGHEVLVLAPEYEGFEDDDWTIRMPAVQNFNGSDFAMPMPLARSVAEEIADFAPDIIHSHHPFLLGDAALRMSARYEVPIVFTYHTRYELYGHYIARDTPFMRRAIRSMAAGYCDLCDAVIAPSRSIATHLEEQEVQTPVHVVPSGIDIRRFERGDGGAMRRRTGIAEEAFVIGHVGRLAPEKNLDFLLDAIMEAVRDEPRACALIVGDGPLRSELEERVTTAGLAGHIRFTGALIGAALAGAYASMDVFAFASHTETQGLVLAEAMSAGVPVIALDAPGAREIVADGDNGLLLPRHESAARLALALDDLVRHGEARLERWSRAARATARRYAIETSVERTVEVYRETLARPLDAKDVAQGRWSPARREIAEELRILGNLATAFGNALATPAEQRPKADA